MASSLAPFAGLCAPLMARTMRSDDSARERFLKSWTHFLSLSLWGWGTVLMVFYSIEPEKADYFEFWYYLGAAVVTVWGVVAQVMLQMTKNVTRRFVSVSIVLMTLAVLCIDLSAFDIVEGRDWPWCVVLVQGGFLFSADPAVVHGTAAVVVVYFFLCGAEEAFDWGMRWEPFRDDPSFVPAICDCARPPCRRPLHSAAIEATTNSCIYLLAFYIARGYQRQVEAERRAMSACIDTAELIAECLSAFDLDGASGLLSENEDLPERLQAAFKALLGNLSMYQPYLPRSCIPVHVYRRSVSMDEADLDIVESDVVESPSDKTTSSKSKKSTVSMTPLSPLSPLSPTAASGKVAEEPVSADASMSTLPTPSKAFDHAEPAISISSVSETGSHGTSHSSTAATPHRNSLTRISSNQFPSVADLRTQHQLQTSRVTLVLCNLHNTLAWHADLDHLRTRIDGMVARAVDAFGKKGIVDHFMGDRIFASYNASRHAACSAVHALTAACAYLGSIGSDVRANVAVGTGRAVCGDVGSATMRRYTIFGALSLQVAGLERFGRAFAVRIVCNHISYMDSHHQFELRRVARNLQLVKYVTRKDGLSAKDKDVCDDMGVEEAEQNKEPVSRPVCDTVYAYEVMTEARLSEDDSALDVLSPRTAQEWMYEIQSSSAAAWESYNAAMAVYLNTGRREAALSVLPERLRPMLATAIPAAAPPPFAVQL
eukprot:TRINITY_DN1276_c0_g2_i1.p1 TRINITY_DN1276_c0_g2~~TRINITY_DN1276_c0_g2_i1.p1  ORF type:complete len:713 (+),score=178.43 TRINITY_DN1276_c0_g2_i1:50-2188(+)